jgi:hypothetical protein
MFCKDGLCMRARRRRIACLCICLALPCILPATGAWAEQKEEVDLSLPSGHPQYTPVAPLPVYATGVDLSAGGLDAVEEGGSDNLTQQVSIDITTGGSTSSDFVAILLDRDGQDNLYIKVQQQDASGKFSHVGFYHGAHAGGWSGMTGGPAFFALAAADKFTSARMSVTHDGAGNVTLRLTNVVGGTDNQVYTRGGWTPRSAASAGMAGWNGIYPIDNWGVAFPGDAVCDNFNRPNGPLGSDWVTLSGTATISGDAARCSGIGETYFVGPCGVVHRVEADVSVVGDNSGYCAMVLNWDGTDNVFVKVQQQINDDLAVFDTVGFYHGKNQGAWPFMTGGIPFFFLPDAERFGSAHMRVTIDNIGNVRLVLTNLDGGNDFREYQRGGWSILGGNGIGFGGWTGYNIVDNIAINGETICDNFNRPNGPLGANWVTDGPAAIVSNAARAGQPPGGYPDDQARCIFTGICGACTDNTPPIVEISSPASFACACNVITVTGSVSDPDGEYIDDVLEYRRYDSDTWLTAATGVGPRSGVLYTWNAAALTDGWYFFRVVGRNACGLSDSDTTIVMMARSFDTVEMRSPVSGSILGGSVCVDGSAWDNQCFQYYTVMYKPYVGGSYNPVDPAHPTYTSAVINDPLATWNTASGPTAVPDGMYLIRLQGVDVCGNAREVVRRVTIDNTAPVATLTAPLNCRYYTGIVPVVGTASDANFGAWTLQYTGGDQHGWVTIASGNSPVVGGVLVNWNTAGLRWCAYTLRLVVTDQATVNCGPWVHETHYYQSLNVGKPCDINGDGAANAFDIDPFVECLTGGDEP